ncbi:MAG: hypothetical protein IPH13_01690 [Planctomycetes bacterium]|nr:hypothetical protein [Planctomycetota bacterium]
MEPDERAVDFDGFWKAALDLYVRPLLTFAAPVVEAAIDWKAGIEPLDKELAALSPDSVAGRRYVDKLVQVRRIDGGASILLIHVEIQGTRDRTFEWRMFTYWVRILDRFGEAPFSIAVLADDDPKWRPTAFEAEVSSTRMRFEFATVKLLDLEPKIDALERSANPFAWLVAIDLRTRRTRAQLEARLVEKTRLARLLLLETRFSRKNKRALYRLLTALMRLPENLEAQVRRKRSIVGGTRGLDPVADGAACQRGGARRRARGRALRRTRRGGA